MRLVFAPNSPVARKYRILLREKRLTDRVVETEAVMHHKDTDESPHAFQQATIMLTPERHVLDQAMEIYAYLDAIGPEPRVLPTGEAERAAAMRMEVLADGALTLAVKLYLDRQSGVQPDESAKQWTERNRQAILKGLDTAEQMSPKAKPIGTAVSMAVTLSFLDRYVPDLAWKKGRPKLAALQTALEERPSFRETRSA